jgi:hypothetical protein
MLRTYELLYSTLWTVSSSPRSPARNFSAKVLATVLGDLMFAELPPNQNSGLGNRVHFMSRAESCFVFRSHTVEVLLLYHLSLDVCEKQLWRQKAWYVE